MKESVSVWDRQVENDRKVSCYAVLHCSGSKGGLVCRNAGSIQCSTWERCSKKPGTRIPKTVSNFKFYPVVLQESPDTGAGRDAPASDFCWPPGHRSEQEFEREGVGADYAVIMSP